MLACLTQLCTIVCFSYVYTSPPKSIRCLRSVNSTAGSESGLPHTDHRPDKTDWALKGLAADGHTHTKNGTMRSQQSALTMSITPEALGDMEKKKDPHHPHRSLSFLTQCPIYRLNLTSQLFLHHSLISTPLHPDSAPPLLSAGVCVCVFMWMSCVDCSIRLEASGKLCSDCEALYRG